MVNEKMILAYLIQGSLYYSESQEEMLEIWDMIPKHAANAAEKLLRDAEWWAKDAGVFDKVRNPRLWMARTALFQALATRAG